MTPVANTIVALIRREAKRDPAAPAILAPGRAPLAYGALVERIDLAIETLATVGFGRGDRIALALPNGPELAVALLAVMGCGEGAPLDPALDEASYLVALRALHIDALMVREGGDTAMVRAARALAVPVIRLAFDSSGPAGTFALSTDAPRPPVAVATPDTDDIALVLQTSGTTAAAKVVPFAQRSIATRALARARDMRHTSADRSLCVAPLHSGMAMRRCLFPVLVAGGSVVCTPAFDRAQFFAWLDQFAPTFYVAVPAIHRAVLDEIDRRGVAPRTTLRYIGSESVTLPAGIERALGDSFGVPVIQGYGLTETGLLTQMPLPPGERRVGSVGVPVDGQIAILDDDGAALPADEAGEIAVRGNSAFAGYEADPEANREAFRGGWFRTGDLGYLDRDGYLFVVGRLKELINRGGTKVSPTLVDAALLRHPAVGDAGTFPVPHPTLGEDVVAAVVLRDGARASAQALRDFAFEQLPLYAVPSRVVTVAMLPRNARGKLQRSELAAALADALRVAFCPPRDAHEERVAGYFAAALGRDKVGAFDNFFEMGGESLSGAQLVNRMNSDLGIDLDVGRLFNRPTVEEFAAEVAAASATPSRAVEDPILPRSR